MKYISEKVKRGGIIAGIAVLVVSQYGVAYASSRTLDVKSYQKTQLEEKYSDWYDNGEVKYAVNIFSDEWDSVKTKDDVVEISQIPETLVKNLSTKELLKLVVESPLVSDIYIYGNSLESLMSVADEFNGLRELLQREDCLEVVTEAYKNIEIVKPYRPDLEALETEQDVVEYINKALKDDELLKQDLEENACALQCDLMELIMLYFATSDNVVELLEIVQDKAEDKKESIVFDYDDPDKFTAAMTEDMPFVESIQTYANGEGRTELISYTDEIKIRVIIDENARTNSRATAEQAVAKYKEDVEIVELGKPSYNCHSYAWLQHRFPAKYRTYWLNIIPDELINTYYTKVDTPTKEGAIVYTHGHSQIVVNPNKIKLEHGKPKPNPVVISKWISGPIVKCDMDKGAFAMENEEVEAYYIIKNKK